MAKTGEKMHCSFIIYFQGLKNLNLRIKVHDYLIYTLYLNMYWIKAVDLGFVVYWALGNVLKIFLYHYHSLLVVLSP